MWPIWVPFLLLCLLPLPLIFAQQQQQPFVAYPRAPSWTPQQMDSRSGGGGAAVGGKMRLRMYSHNNDHNNNIVEQQLQPVEGQQQQRHSLKGTTSAEQSVETQGILDHLDYLIRGAVERPRQPDPQPPHGGGGTRGNDVFK
uniref:Uncharacterized protein n=1 Tax=Globodera rostochiensis TaxID=31243 RepID=A0A914H4L6_GLORO